MGLVLTQRSITIRKYETFDDNVKTSTPISILYCDLQHGVQEKYG